MANSVQVREIALKTDINGDNHNKTFRDEHVTQRLEPEMPEEQAPTTVGQVVPRKTGRRPWVWALMGAAALAAAGVSIAYYVHSLSFEPRMTPLSTAMLFP